MPRLVPSLDGKSGPIQAQGCVQVGIRVSKSDSCAGAISDLRFSINSENCGFVETTRVAQQRCEALYNAVLTAPIHAHLPEAARLRDGLNTAIIESSELRMGHDRPLDSKERLRLIEGWRKRMREQDPNLIHDSLRQTWEKLGSTSADDLVSQLEDETIESMVQNELGFVRKEKLDRILRQLDDLVGLADDLESDIQTFRQSQAVSAERRAELAQLLIDRGPVAPPTGNGNGEQPLSSFQGYVSADALSIDEGIMQNRLSEGAKSGKIKTMTAPKGLTDSRGRKVRTLYQREDAIKHCKPTRRSNKRTH